MGIGKLGFSQEIRDGKKPDFEEAPKFTEDEVEVLQKFESMCLEKGVNADALVEKLARFKK